MDATEGAGVDDFGERIGIRYRKGSFWMMMMMMMMMMMGAMIFCFKVFPKDASTTKNSKVNSE